MLPPRTTPLILGTLGAAFGLALGLTHQLAEDLQPRSLEAAPADALPTNAAFVVAKPSCTPTAGKKVADAWEACSDEDEKTCAKYDPPLSDRCAAESSRSHGVKVDYTYFGEADCRSWHRKRKIERIAIHNGGSAKLNASTWKCRPAASHYTINRDGKIFQHVGEERASAHANTENEDTIGIELESMVAYGGSCNSTKTHASIASKRGIAKEDVAAEMCGPTRAQYEALRALVADIETRHPIADDGLFGHCEVKAGTHGDPRAFDWRELGVPMRKSIHNCTWNDVVAVKGRVTKSVPGTDSVRFTIDRGKDHGLEVGDHGYLEDERERIVGWFALDEVTAKTSTVTLPVPFGDVFDKVNVTLVATPSKKPSAMLSSAALLGKKAGGAPPDSLGSCSTDYTYWKKGEIASWTIRIDGTIDTVVIANAGSKHRICSDSTGMVYADTVDGAFLTDASGNKVKLTATSVYPEAVTMKVTGSIDAKRLGKSRRVVLRAKK